jgi:hypothetical protein
MQASKQASNIISNANGVKKKKRFRIEMEKVARIRRIFHEKRFLKSFAQVTISWLHWQTKIVNKKGR